MNMQTMGLRLALAAALALTGCGGGGEAFGDPPSAGESTTFKAMAPEDRFVMVPVPPEPEPDPSMPRLTVADGAFVVRSHGGFQRLLEDPDGSGPLQERPITPVTLGPMLSLPAGTELAHALGAHYRVTACSWSMTTERIGWASIPRPRWTCDGPHTAVRLDAPAIARAFAMDRSFAISPAGTRAAFARRGGNCTEIRVIDTRGERDRVTHFDLAGTGSCSATNLSLALGGDHGVLAIGIPRAPDAQGRPVGAVHMRALVGDDWWEVARLTAPAPSAGAGFGTSVALSANAQRLLVGAPGATAGTKPLAGAAHLFEAPFRSPSWTLARVFTGWHAGDRLGALVGMNPAGDAVTLVAAALPGPTPAFCADLRNPGFRGDCLLDFEGWFQTLAFEQGAWRPARLDATQSNGPEFQAALLALTAEAPPYTPAWRARGENTGLDHLPRP